MFKKLIFGQTYTKFTFAMSTLNQIIEKVNLGSSDSQKNRYIDRENENIGT